MPNSAPLIIGATGGSGTRVVARLTRHAGYDLGHNTNSADDALEFYSFHDRWINPFFSARSRGKELRKSENASMEEQFQAALNRHFPVALRERAETCWGWKAPRSIYLLPFLHMQFPELKFIHVLRDGRDMALSPNQNQLQKHGPAVLNWRERFFYSLPERSFLLWQRINVSTAEFGEAELGENYLRVRFEDLCARPVEITGEMFKFLGATIDPEPVARAEISPPATIQRWQSYPSSVVAKLQKISSHSLRRFGYQQ